MMMRSALAKDASPRQELSRYYSSDKSLHSSSHSTAASSTVTDDQSTTMMDLCNDDDDDDDRSGRLQDQLERLVSMTTTSTTTMKLEKTRGKRWVLTRQRDNHNHNAAHNHDQDIITIDFSVQNDRRSFVASTTILNINHSDILSPPTTNRKDRRPSYSLMTKVMKHKALLSRSSVGPKLAIFDGKCVLYQHFPDQLLFPNNLSSLDKLLDVFVEHSTTIGTELKLVQQRETSSNNNNKKKRLLRML